MSPGTETRPGPESGPNFAEEFASAVGALRTALTQTMTELGADASRPQEVARRFQLNKNLAWKLSRLIREPDPATALRFVPGTSGVRIALEALGPEAPQGIVACEEAFREFEAMQARHAGDRATLEMLIAGLAYDRIEPEAFEQARRQAFQGNASIWGVQARTQFSSYILAPNEEDPNWADLVLAAGLVDFRRTRPDARWILGTRQAFDSAGGSIEKRTGTPVAPSPQGPAGVPLLEDFCSTPLPDVEVVRSGNELRYELPGGPIGNSSLTTATYAEIERRAGPCVQSSPGEEVELVMNLLTPAEHAQFDLLIHRDLGWTAQPTLQLYGRLHGLSPFSPAEEKDRTIPTQERPELLGSGSKTFASERVPRCAELTQYAIRAGGWDPEDFTVWRVSMSYPPIPSAVVLSLELPERR